MSGEQALQREVVIETKPSRDGLVEYFAKKTLGCGVSAGHPENDVRYSPQGRRAQGVFGVRQPSHAVSSTDRRHAQSIMLR